MRQLYRAHAALFVCAYVGFLGYFALTDPHNPVAALLAVRPDVDERPRPLVIATPAAATRSEAAAAPIAAAESVLIAHEVSPPAVPDDTARQKEYARLREVRLQATGADEPQKRAAAIDQLNSATPETLQALQTVVTSDIVVRNRIRALNSLRALADRADAKDAVISIVHLAMVDTNASVASRASEVYRELTREQTSLE